MNTLTFTYDGVGNLLTARDDDGAYTLTYDALDRLDTEKDLFGKTLTFSYDGVSNRTLLQDSDGGYTTSTYDGLDRVTGRQFSNGTTPLRIDFTYTARDQMESATRYSDLAGTTKVGSSLYTYDATSRLENLKHRNSSDTALANYTYTYDLADKVKTEVRNGTTVTLAYDATDQLTDDTNTAYSYDLNGNRTMTGYQTGSGNRMTNDGVYAYTYDAEGNVSKKSKGATQETTFYTYDHNNQMTGAEKRAEDNHTSTLQLLATYTYDAVAQRVQKAVYDGSTTTTERYAYDLGKGQLSDAWADLDGSSSLTSRRIYGDGVDQPLSRVVGTTVVHFLADRLGSIRELANNSTGAFIYEVTYNGFGKTIAEVNPTNRDRIGFAAYWFDAELSLYNVRRRKYDAATGQWLQEDPSGLGDDDHPRGYVKNNPVMFVDPSGLAAATFRSKGGPFKKKAPPAEKPVVTYDVDKNPSNYEYIYDAKGQKQYLKYDPTKPIGSPTDQQDSCSIKKRDPLDIPEGATLKYKINDDGTVTTWYEKTVTVTWWEWVRKSDWEKEQAGAAGSQPAAMNFKDPVVVRQREEEQKREQERQKQQLEMQQQDLLDQQDRNRSQGMADVPTQGVTALDAAVDATSKWAARGASNWWDRTTRGQKFKDVGAAIGDNALGMGRGIAKLLGFVVGLFTDPDDLNSYRLPESRARTGGIG